MVIGFKSRPSNFQPAPPLPSDKQVPTGYSKLFCPVAKQSGLRPFSSSLTPYWPPYPYLIFPLITHPPPTLPPFISDSGGIGLCNNQKAPWGLAASRTTLMPSLRTTLMLKDDWLITKRSLMELRHLSMIFSPSSSVNSLVCSVSITDDTKYSAYPWQALVVSMTDPRQSIQYRRGCSPSNPASRQLTLQGPLRRASASWERMNWAVSSVESPYPFLYFMKARFF